MKKLLVALMISILFIGCGGMKLEDFDNKLPKMVLEDYFDGNSLVYGLVKNRSGEIIRSFKGNIDGSWDENGVGVLDEKFTYDDGEVQYRKWTLKPLGNNTYEAKANDTVGIGQLRVNGNTILMNYTLRIPYKDSTIDINIDDWLHLQEDGVIINHSKMKKFGFVVGELVVTIIKE